MTLEEHFASAKSLMEIFRIQNSLKEAGEFDVAEINNAATARKKELSKTSGKFVSPLVKHKPAATESKKVTQFNIVPEHLNIGRIEFDGTTFHI